MYCLIALVWALVAATVVSLPSPKTYREVSIARRSSGGNTPANDTEFSASSAGAFLSASAGTFTGAVATLIVPSLGVPEGEDPNTSTAYGGSAFVGLDTFSCPNGIAAGIEFNLQSGSQTFNVFYQTFGDNAISSSPDMSLTAGDAIMINVAMTNTTSSTVYIINQSTGQTVFDVVSTEPLCGENAHWLLQGIGGDGVPLPFPNFGKITFAGANAETISGPVGISGATIIDLEQNNTVLTTVSTSYTNVDISYI